MRVQLPSVQLLHWRLLGVCALCLVFTIAVSDDIVHDIDKFEIQLFPPPIINVVHVTTVTVKHDVVNASNEHRHKHEKARLLRRLRRGRSNLKSKADRGNTNHSHPRDRLLAALYAFSKYGEAASAEIQRFKDLYGHTPQKHKDLLQSTIDHGRTFVVAQSLIQKNALVLDAMVENALEYYQVTRQELNMFIRQAEKDERKPDRTAVSQVIKLFVRDWSVQGAYERKDTIPCILDTIRQYLPTLETSLEDHAPPIKVLVPGAGLNRLAHEISGLSPRLAVTSNEWSSYVNIAYRYLETLSVADQITIHPYIESWSHLRTRSEAERGISIPDIITTNTNANVSSTILLVEGDFTRTFNAAHSGTYDFIITLFFIDTARNILAYFDTIHRLLKPGGLWINLGPLLYGSAPFMQLSLDEIVAVVKGMGFRFEKAHPGCGVESLRDELVLGKEALYNFNGSALNKFAYEAQVWVARKV